MSRDERDTILASAGAQQMLNRYTGMKAEIEQHKLLVNSISSANESLLELGEKGTQ